MNVILDFDAGKTVALGAETNNAIAITNGKKCRIEYIGDCSRLENIERIRSLIDKPDVVLCDLHPTYSTTLLAENYRHVKVQHHKAHVAGAAAEHGLKDYVGIAMDGMGYGEDGHIWGGEAFESSPDFKRIGHLEYMPMIGGDASTKDPKKMLFGVLSKVMDDKKLLEMRLFDESESKLNYSLIQQNFNVFQTSSAGRILDAVSALLGFEGKIPAVALEKNATVPYDFDPVIKENILMTSELFRYLLKNLHKDKGRLAATAQMYLAKGMFQIADVGKSIVFSGGVAHNRRISGYLKGKGVLLNKKIPCGDDGLCFGQIMLQKSRK